MSAIRTNRDVTVKYGEKELAVFWPPTGESVTISDEISSLIVAPSWNNLPPVEFPDGAVAYWKDADSVQQQYPHTMSAAQKAEAQAQIEALCGPDGQDVERLFAKAQQAQFKLNAENNPFPDRAPDPTGAEAARKVIADYTAASTAYQNLVAVLRS